MSVNGRNKGKAGEREAANVLVGWAKEVGVEIGIERNLTQTRGGGHDLSGLEPFGLAVEVKRHENPNLPGFWRQAVKQGELAGCTPVLMWRQNRRPWAFRVRAFVWPSQKPLDIDMPAEVFKVWYQAQVLAGKGASK